jgi:hypothetical protein
MSAERFYKVSTRNVKMLDGRWSSALFQRVGQLSLCHVEKSVFLIERFYGSNPQRSRTVLQMGCFDDSVKA